MKDLLRKFAFYCSALLLAVLIIVAVANLFLPLVFVCEYGSKMWFLLYIAEPFLIFACVFAESLLERF